MICSQICLIQFASSAELLYLTESWDYHPDNYVALYIHGRTFYYFSAKKQEMTSEVKSYFAMAERCLQKCIKSCPVDAVFIEGSFLMLAVMHLLLKNTELCQNYSKQAYYAMKRNPGASKRIAEDAAFRSSLSIMKWKHPDMGLTFNCDHCNTKKWPANETGMKKCQCQYGFYCSDECQREHRPIHKDVCLMKQPKRMEF